MLLAALLVPLALSVRPTVRAPAIGAVRAAAPIMALKIPLSDLNVDKVREYTRPDEMLEYLLGLRGAYPPTDVHFRRMLATAYASARKYQQAETHVDVALAADASDLEMRFLKGVAREHAGEVEDALDAYEMVLDAEPKNWRALFHVGKISMQARAPCAPQRPRTRATLWLSHRSPPSLQVGWVDDAREYFEQVLEIEPEHLATREIVERLRQIDQDTVGDALAEEMAPETELPPMPTIDLELPPQLP